MSRLHILYDHQMFAIQRFGGITRMFIELARYFSRRPDCAVHWYRGLHMDEYDVSEFRRYLARYLALPRLKVGIPGLTHDRINRIGFESFIRTALRTYDIYHPSYYDASLTLLVKAKHTVVTVHDMIPELFLADQKRFQPTIAGKRLLVQTAELVFAVSENTKGDLVNILAVDSSKVRVAPNASCLNEVPTARLPAMCGEKPYFLYVGARSKYKNFVVLQHSFSGSEWLRNNFRLVCFGGTSGYLEDELAFFREHGLGDSFVYLSGGDPLLKALYEGAVALVYTSRYEGFGLPPLEAMQCGCPVICCPTSSLPEVVGDAALFFGPDSPEELAEQMRKLAEDSLLRQELIRRGRQRANLFSWDKTALAVLAGYRELGG